MVDILNLLKASDTPAEDQKMFLKAQILCWLIGATDGHAKNFSIFLGPGGRFQMTPLYDVLTAQPSLDARQIVSQQMKLAMSVGRNGYNAIGIMKHGISCRPPNVRASRGRLRVKRWMKLPGMLNKPWRPSKNSYRMNFPRHFTLRRETDSCLGLRRSDEAAREMP